MYAVELHYILIKLPNHFALAVMFNIIAMQLKALKKGNSRYLPPSRNETLRVSISSVYPALIIKFHYNIIIQSDTTITWLLFFIDPH